MATAVADPFTQVRTHTAKVLRSLVAACVDGTIAPNDLATQCKALDMSLDDLQAIVKRVQRRRQALADLQRADSFGGKKAELETNLQAVKAELDEMRRKHQQAELELASKKTKLERELREQQAEAGAIATRAKQSRQATEPPWIRDRLAEVQRQASGLRDRVRRHESEAEKITANAKKLRQEIKELETGDLSPTRQQVIDNDRRRLASMKERARGFRKMAEQDQGPLKSLEADFDRLVALQRDPFAILSAAEA